MSGALVGAIALPTAAQTEADAASASAAETSAVAEDPALAQARIHFANGVELLQSVPPNYQDAFPQFLAAYEKSGRSWKVLGNLGLCALKLERDGEALAYYRQYLDDGGDEIDPDERAAIEKELLLVEGNMAEVTLRSLTPKVQVTVARQGSNAPPQVYRLTDEQTVLGLRAGALTLTAQGDGKTKTWEVVLTPGQKIQHEFDFAESAENTSVLAPSPATDSRDSGGMSPVRLTGFVTAGAGAAALIGGVVTGLLSKQKEQDALEQCEGRACAPSARDDFDSAKSLATVTNVLLIGGGVLAATGVTLVVLGGNSKKSENPSAARLILTPTALPQGGGLSASGTF